MSFFDLLDETYLALSGNKVRSALTMLGIVIGIASVIAMVAIGTGAQNSISSSIEGLGSNLLSITPGVIQPGRGVVSSGRGSAQTLKNDDVAVVKTISGVDHVSPEVTRRFQIVGSSGNNTNTTVYGVTPDYLPVHNSSVSDGDFVSDANVNGLGRVAVLGPTTAQDLFPDDTAVGKTIRINGSSFTVIGVMASKGGSGFFNPDDAVYVPLSTMQKILVGNDYLSTISVSVATKDQMADAKDAIMAALAAKHNVDPANPDFSVVSQADILGALNTVTGTFTIFLASVAGISLLVGGIGIMNMMLTTVTERTREIGLRKAIGAHKEAVSIQFLMEALALTFIGGTTGIALGWLISLGVSSFAGIATQVSLSSVALAFGVSAAIGIVFGYYPAHRAAKLNPIEALRYE